MSKTYLIFLLSLCFAACLSACSNDSGDNISQPEYSPEDLVSVELSVPYVSFDGKSSRAESSAYIQEGWLSNAYLVVVKYSGNESVGFNIYELDTTGYNPLVGEDKAPSNFYINLYPGTYKFYLLANFDRYLSRFSHISNVKSEEELQSIVLNFDSSMPLVPAHLPMACFPEGFSLAPGATGITQVGDKFTISSKSNPSEGGSTSTGNNGSSTTPTRNIIINATLKFQCAKVRYTILFNNTVGGMSEQFGNNSIRFIVNQTTDRPKANNIRGQLALIPEKGVLDEEKNYLEGNWTLDLSRYKFPTINGVPNEDYPLSSSDQLEPWEDQPNLVQWKKSQSRAWQGIVYLPENNNLEKFDRYTTLSFPYVLEKYKGEDGNYEDYVFQENEVLPEKEFSLFGNVDDIHYAGDYKSEGTKGTHGLQRGFFYDVVAKVKNVNSDRLEMFIQLFVGDHPWIYHKNEEGQIW